MYIRDTQQLLNPEHAKPQVKLHPVAKNEAVTILHHLVCKQLKWDTATKLENTNAKIIHQLTI